MRPESPKYLEDIRDAAEFVLETTREIDLADYLDNDRIPQSENDQILDLGSAHRLQRNRAVEGDESPSLRNGEG